MNMFAGLTGQLQKERKFMLQYSEDLKTQDPKRFVTVYCAGCGEPATNCFCFSETKKKKR